MGGDSSRQFTTAGSSEHRVPRVKDMLKCPASVPCRAEMTRPVESAEKQQESKTQVVVTFEREELYAA